MTTKRMTRIAIVVAVFALFVGCKKEHNSYENLDNTSYPKLINCPPIVFGIDIEMPLHSQDISKLLTREGDPDGEKINQQLYYLSLAIQDLVKSSEFNHKVISMAKASYNQSADLNQLLLNNPEYKSIIDKNLAEYGTTFQEIFENMTRTSPERKSFEKYKPIIFIPNLDIINPDKQPIFSPNIEVDCSNDESIEDNIVAWYYTESGEKVEIMVSEENSLVLTNPLFLLDNGEIDPKPRPKVQNSVEKFDPDDKSTTTYFYINEFNLYHYFEFMGKPEFSIVAYRFDEEISHSSINRIYYSNSGYGNEVDNSCRILRKVDRSEICSLVEHWCVLFKRFTNTSSRIIAYNTFERDWNHSEKPLGHLYYLGPNYTNHLYLYGRMQYDSDWYGIEPDNVGWNTTFSQDYIYNNWAKWYFFTNSCMRAWRVEL